MHRRLLVSSFGALLLAVCGIASAQNAYTARPMNVRAGPNRGYPLVAQLDAGAPLDVHGCLDGWSWCDVSFDGNRGWMYSGGISFVYNGGRVPLYSYGPQLGLPIITFSLGAYWGQYYRGRPWYAQRNTWAHRNFPPPARLAGPAGRPQPGPRPMTPSRPPVTAHPGGQMPGHTAPPAGRGPPKGGHAQRPKALPSSHGNEQGNGDRPHNPP
jgi:uncharacterized protein YraI